MTRPPARAVSGSAVATAADRDVESLRTRVPDCGRDVSSIGAACNRRRTLVDRPVVDAPRFVVPFVVRRDERSSQLRAKLVQAGDRRYRRHELPPFWLARYVRSLLITARGDRKSTRLNSSH